MDLARKAYKLLRDTHPHLYIELSPENPVDLDQVGPGFPGKLLWIGSCGHTFAATAKNRSQHGSGCPYCANKKVLPGFNDLAYLRPDIAKDWSDRNEFGPADVTPGSNKRVWWVCPNYKHEWATNVVNRTARGSGCPSCAGKDSRGESSLYEFIVEHYDGTGPVIRNERGLAGISELDVWIPVRKVAFEYNGTYWHSAPDVQRRDRNKAKKCEESGIALRVVTDKDWLLRREETEALVLETLKRAPEDSL